MGIKKKVKYTSWLLLKPPFIICMTFIGEVVQQNELSCERTATVLHLSTKNAGHLLPE